MKNATKKAAIRAAILEWAIAHRIDNLPWREIAHKYKYRHKKKAR